MPVVLYRDSFKYSCFFSRAIVIASVESFLHFNCRFLSLTGLQRGRPVFPVLKPRGDVRVRMNFSSRKPGLGSAALEKHVRSGTHHCFIVIQYCDLSS